ncbi:exocyst complex component Sec10-domain-containing protein [Boletus reticuloceps]|uniref:Exocyst complex component Sec10-domain-containing protein n=1 Tax=Boletus reticuloceps TaxID=495285 RepID=A0A8I3AE55_9AGAM|nr:exocyst complex component Sec10-domain-containing protein [Boletus reticuloceps]
MDKFATLEPTKLYSSPTQHQRPSPFSTVTSHVKSTARVSTQVLTAAKPPSPPIGRLPVDLHVLTLMHVPIPDIARYARASRATSRVARDERVWERRWLDLAAQRLGLTTILDELEARAKAEKDKRNGGSCGPATLAVSSLDDDFGDFASAPPPALFDLSSSARLSIVDTYEPGKPTPTFRAKYIRAHTLLYPLLPTPNAPLMLSSHPLLLSCRPARIHLLRVSLHKPAFDATLLTAFDAADTSGDEAQMKGVASASWEISICTNSMGRRNKRGGAGDWEMGRLWAEKREVFYEQGKWDPAANFTKDTRLDFTAMDGFMSHVLAAIEEDGARAFRVFPRESGVLLAFAERIADDVISEYISSLLARARTISIPLFLSATAACFREAFRVADSILTVSGGSKNRGRDGDSGAVKVELAEDVIYKMFEPNMDDYLDDEMDELKRAFEVICKDWERSVSLTASSMVTLDRSQSQTQAVQAQTRFLDSQNPALMKRNVLASFTDVLLLPVTIVPRAVGAGVGAVGAIGTGVGAAIGTGVGAVGTGVVQGIAMLNPQRWVGNGGAVEAAGVGEDDDEPEDADAEGSIARGSEEGSVSVGVSIEDEAGWGEIAECQTRGNAGAGPDTGAFDASGVSKRTGSTSDVASTKAATTLISTKDASRFGCTIHAMKRLETFAAYPGATGTRVRETLDETFCQMLNALSTRHVAWGFGIANERMTSYKPAEHEGTTSVAPLLQFFELVHIGDTIQSMVQVFFDKEIAPHIDKTDFLNVIVRERKRFEDMLDECVASGLNAGTQVLMNQVDHIIQTLTKLREYYPPEDAPLDLRPTEGCREAIQCLETHCKLLKGNTSRELLEVFYQEVGIRLLAILQKHIKRQIISLNGGFQVIADLNAYHAFIASLKVPNVTTDFDHLKMLGHVFVVDDAKDLAQIVRDCNADVYEFIQRRSDWKKIEKTVDKAMYNLSFKEDCVVC